LPVLHVLQHVEMMRGHPAASREYGRRLVQTCQAPPDVYNNLAWAAVLEGKIDETTLRDAQKAVMDSQGLSGACLHTLATVYADLGRAVEARNVLLQAIRSRNNPEPEVHDWYVLGRIAEEYDAREAAVVAYHRTAAAEGADQPNSTNQLSLRRLRMLGEK